MRSGLVSLMNVLDWVAMCTPVVIESATGRIDKKVCDDRLAAWAPRVLARAKAKLTVIGREAVDASQPAVLMSNHASFYDIPVVYATYGGNLRMVAKKELFRIPIIGQAMRGSGMIEVDRGDRAQAVESLAKGTKALVDSGSSVWIAPEGTRTTTGELKPFKKGGFRLAMDARLPILPISLKGTLDLLPPHTVETRLEVPVVVRYHAPIDTAVYAEESDPKVALERLMTRVREVIQSGL